MSAKSQVVIDSAVLSYKNNIFLHNF